MLPLDIKLVKEIVILEISTMLVSVVSSDKP